MPAWHIHRFDEVTSTQDVAHGKTRDGAAEGTVIVAAFQSKGRGRSGNAWQSLTGNLFCSILLRPDIEPAQAGQYSFLSAVALNRTLSEFTNEGHAIQNKWPNDVLVDGKKIAGILLEAVIEENNVDALIIGMGVNITSAPDDKVFVNAIADKHETAESFLNAFLAQLDEILEEYNREGFSALKEEWIDHAFNLSQPIKVRLPNSTLEGVFEGLEADGALRLRLANGDIKVIHSGEVFFG